VSNPFDSLLQERGIELPAAEPTEAPAQAPQEQPGIIRRVARDVATGVMEAPAQIARGAAEGVDAAAGWAYNGSLAAYLPEPVSVTGGIVNDVTQFATGFIAAGRALRALGWARGVTAGGNVARGMVQGAVADAGFFDGHEERLSNLVESYPALSNPVTEFLAADPNDSEAEGRLKAAVEGLLVGGAVESLILALRGVRAVRRGDRDGAAAVGDNADPTPDPFTPEEAAKRAAADAEGDPQVKPTAPEGAAPEAVPDDPNLAAVSRVGRMRERFAVAEDRALRAAGDTEDAPPTLRPVQVRAADSIIELTPEQHRAIARQSITELGFGQGRNLSGIRVENITDDPALAANFSAHEVIMRDELRAMKGPETVTFQDTLNLAREMGEELGGRPELLVQRMIAETSDVAGAHARLLTYRNFIRATFDKHQRFQTALADPRGNDLAGFPDRVKLAEAYERTTTLLLHLQGLYKGIQSSYARGLNAMRIAARSDDDLARYVERIQMQAIRGSLTQGNLKATLAHARGSFASRVLGTINEYWINALLSGPKTHVVNMVSNVATAAFQPAERMIAGALRLNRAEFQEGAFQYAGLVMSIRESLALAGKALRQGDGILDPGRSPVERRAYVTAERFDVNNQVAAHVVNGLGATIRLPSRLLTTQDEFFKQLTYRGRVRAEAWRAALDAGHLPGSKEFGEEVARRLDEAVDRVTGIATDQRHLDGARNVTFTDDLGAQTWSGGRTLGETLMSATGNHPLLQIVLPFVRTPTNIARFVWNRTPGLNLLRAQYAKDFFGQNGPEAAGRARAMMATGGLMWGGALSLAFDGTITGGGPSDPFIRRQLMESGWRPYSIRVTNPDGSVEFRAFDRLDPFASFLGVAADFAEVAGFLGERERDQLALDMMIALARQLQNKTYLSGLTRAIGALANPAQNGERWLYGLTGSFIPAAVNQTLRDDPYMREVRGIIDSFRARMPGSEGLDPVRNILGEPIAIPAGWGPDSISPIATSSWAGQGAPPVTREWRWTVQNDVHGEIARQLTIHNSAIRPPAPKIGNVDLREFRVGDTERTAYDRFQALVGEVEVGGMTVRERLSDLIQSDTYRNRATDGTFDHDGSRVDMIRQVLGAFRERALRELGKELPEVGEALRRDIEIRNLTKVQSTAP
jgi:hypothetical protein